MPLDGSNIFSLPSGTTVTTNTTVESVPYNTFLADPVSVMNTTIAISRGGTGGTSASTARTALGLAIGTNVQAYDADLAALAGLTSAADKVPYFTGSATAAVADFTSYGRSLVAVADEAALKTLVNLEIGTDVQAFQAVQAESAWTTGTSTTESVVSPAKIQAQIQAQPRIRAWVRFVASSGTPTITTSSGVSSITDNGVGDYTINLSSSISGAAYCAVVEGYISGDTRVFTNAYSYAAGSVRILTKNVNGVPIDPEIVTVVIIG